MKMAMEMEMQISVMEMVQAMANITQEVETETVMETIMVYDPDIPDQYHFCVFEFLMNQYI